MKFFSFAFYEKYLHRLYFYVLHTQLKLMLSTILRIQSEVSNFISTENYRLTVYNYFLKQNKNQDLF